jgi:hypothetical protein
MELIIGIVICVAGAWFCYMSAHINDEEKKGKYIPLPWEKKDKFTFNKHSVEYRDGDNT